MEANFAYLEHLLPKDSNCEVRLVHKEKQDLSKHVFMQEKIRVTLMISNKEFVKAKYQDFHKEGLMACPTNQWPLALAKSTDVNTNSVEQSYYNYPMVRYPLSTKGTHMFPIDMNTYYFRFNETQRFFFEVGSNFVVNHAILKLTPT